MRIFLALAITVIAIAGCPPVDPSTGDPNEQQPDPNRTTTDIPAGTYSGVVNAEYTAQRNGATFADETTAFLSTARFDAEGLLLIDGEPVAIGKVVNFNVGTLSLTQTVTEIVLEADAVTINGDAVTIIASEPSSPAAGPFSLTYRVDGAGGVEYSGSVSGVTDSSILVTVAIEYEFAGVLTP